MRGAAFRGDFHGRLGHAPETDRIALLGGQVAERAREAPRIVEPGGPIRPEPHGAAGVDEKTEAEVRIRLKFLDVEAVAAAPGAPVESPRIIPGDVLPILRKLE